MPSIPNKKPPTALIIGGGIIGLCAAHYLSEAGFSVTVIEQKTPGFGSSTGNAGLIVPSHFIPLAAPGVIARGMKWMLNPESPFYIKPRPDWDLLSWLWKFRGACRAAHVAKSMPLLLQLHLQSKELYEELARRPELDFHLQNRGLLMLCNSEHGWQELSEMVAAGQKIGLKPRMVSPPEIEALDSTVQTSARGGAYFPEDAHLDPQQFIAKMSRHLQQKGVSIRSGVAGQGFVAKNGHIRALQTPAGEIFADWFVLAGGAFSPVLARQLGLKLPIQAGKGYSITIEKPKNMPQTPLILEEARVAVTPMGERLRFAGTMEIAGLDFSVNRRRVDAILKAIPRYLPQVDLSGTAQVTPWAGLRPCTPDGLPYLGRTTRFRNLIIATGHAMIGVSLAPVTGRIVANLAAGHDPEMDISLLHPERFG